MKRLITEEWPLLCMAILVIILILALLIQSVKDSVDWREYQQNNDCHRRVDNSWYCEPRRNTDGK